MFLQDVVNKNTVCLLVPPTSHLVAAPCNPVYALNTKLQALLIKGDTLETSLEGNHWWRTVHVGMDVLASKLHKQGDMKLNRCDWGFHVSAGEQEPSCSSPSQGGGQSQLFIFHFGESDIIKQYIVPPPVAPQQQEKLSCVTLEESCDLYLQQRLFSFCLFATIIWICGVQLFWNCTLKMTSKTCRPLTKSTRQAINVWMFKQFLYMCLFLYVFMCRALSVEERNKAISQTWKRLQETAETQQSCSKKWLCALIQSYFDMNSCPGQMCTDCVIVVVETGCYVSSDVSL